MKKKTIVFYALLAICAAVFIFCAVQLIRYAVRSQENKSFYEELSALHTTAPAQSTGATAGTPAPTVSLAPNETLPPTEPTEPQMLEEMAPIYAINNHVVGWIQIQGTRVDYPVLQTPNAEGWWDYYLYRDFDGNYNQHGSIYARESCDVFAPSDNIVIYGHNMADHSMFGELFDYKYESYYQEHPTIRFDTLYERHTYAIFAVFRTSGTIGEGFAYHLFSDAARQSEFDAFVAQCKELSFYDTGITPEYGDKLITLSTCDFHINNGRLVVVAVRVD